MASRRTSFSSSHSASLASNISADVQEFSDKYDGSAPPVGLDMAGHDTFLLGPKVVMLDSFVVDLLHVDTSAQTFKLKLLVNMDWEDDGTIEPEYKAKRNLGRTGTTLSQGITQGIRRMSHRSSFDSTDNNNQNGGERRPTVDMGSSNYTARSNSMGDGSDRGKDHYKTGKYVPRPAYIEDPLSTTWNPEVVLVNAIADEEPIEAGSKFHCINMLSGRPVVSRSVMYQPECRCAFSFQNFPFDETDLVIKFSSNKWNSEQVNFMWSHRLQKGSNTSNYSKRWSQLGRQTTRSSIVREASFLKKTVDESAIGGVGLSEFEIVRVRVESDEKDVNSMQRYDNAEGAFSEAHLIIRVRRDPYSYLLRVASVAELLMFLEVLSFLTDNGDLSARFSISGTIFLAMVSLYGPMADALPKVSVVTRVDKWHLSNFVLLFASNVENLIAFVLREHVNVTLIEYMEVFMACVYLYFVVHNLIWFISPLKDRDEFSLVVVWFEDTVDRYQEKWEKFMNKVKRSKILPWNWGGKEETPPNPPKRDANSPGQQAGFNVTKAAVRFKRSITGPSDPFDKKKNGEVTHWPQAPNRKKVLSSEEWKSR